MECGTIADWVNAAVAFLALITAGIALRQSLKIDRLNSKLLERQVNAEYVYWHVKADNEKHQFEIRNIGTNAAIDVNVHAFIEGTNHLEGAHFNACAAGETVVMVSEDFLAERGLVSRYYGMVNTNRMRGRDTNPLTIQVLVEWKDSLGFHNHQIIEIRYA
ncbi:hypothetical protein [uncultured Bifidobacterium sp.]|uniref:hypothetical protein n=1 Tax=uncultured Bifidobacterium sp. TaxID=165187 RepID=UPI0025937B4C|nr:hypothetical protein [uncultured Bifidobacterium sp.]